MTDGRPQTAHRGDDRAITGTTGLIGLLGDPVGHSLSPALHNAAIRAIGLDLRYLAFHVAPGRMADAMDGLDALGAVGANVTIPHKRTALDLAATASRTARALGAANTLVRSDDGWHAENTDVVGFLTPLDAHRDAIAGRSVVVLGAGGAARAVAYAGLTALGADVIVAARRTEQAAALVHDLAGLGPIRAVALADATPAVRSAALVVNATPLGMGDGRTPWPDADDLRPGQIVYDLVYRPRPTPLLVAAAARGAVAIDGLPMLIGQAAASFCLWTGRDMPLDVARSAALSALDADR